MVELIVNGTLDTRQFWPEGTSDADTTKILVQVHGFQVREDGGAMRETHVFDGAKVKGRSGTRPVLNNAGKMTVRLQGIDAPELHYTAAPLKSGSGVTPALRKKYNEINEDFRQPLGETATVALGDMLRQGGDSELACSAATFVEKPNDVFDTYGRFVGEIRVTIGGQQVVVNQWLAKNGWAYPGFYTSMSAEEIQTLLDASAAAKSTSLLWKKYTGTIGTLNQKLIFRRGGPPDPAADKGPVLMPKLFRRLVAWTVAKKAKVPGTPSSFLKSLEANAVADAFFLTDDFLEQGAHAAVATSFPEHFSAAGKFQLKPDEMVFREAPSTLLNAAGEKVVEWD